MYSFLGYDRGRSINAQYIDGLSFTHGTPRTHICIGHLQLVYIKVILYIQDIQTITALVTQATPTAPLLLLVMTISVRVV